MRGFAPRSAEHNNTIGPTPRERGEGSSERPIASAPARQPGRPARRATMPSRDAKTQSIIDFLQQRCDAKPELAGEFSQMVDLYTRKLWHQLTVLLEAFVLVPAASGELIPLYDTFISDFKHKISEMALVRLQMAVARQHAEPEKGAFFGNAVAEEARKQGDAQASIYILSELARLLLDYEKVDECKSRLDEAAALMEGCAGLEMCVQAAYYRAWSAYYKIKGPALEFYKTALLLLAYAPLDEMSADEALTISFDLGIAALVGEQLYNFGELLEHPVVATLERTEFAWLAHLLRAFNAGDIDQYEALVARHHEQLEAQPALLSNTNFLKEKITLMCLAEALFHRIGPGADRTVSFEHIASASKLPVDQVELLVMRALSLKLVRGTIDQVAQTLRVSWVQPRVLQEKQIRAMSERLAQWSDTVAGTLTFLETETPEFAS